jgi:2-methylcitrate dehydratase PrpD
MGFDDKGEFRWSRLSGNGASALGAATAACAVAGLDAERAAHALALLTWIAPTAHPSDMAARTAFNSLKYSAYGQAAHSGVMAAMLAEEGYLGDLDALDGDPSFAHAQGFLDADLDLLTDELGERWWITETAIKFYPSCRYTHAPIDALREFLDGNGLSPTDIEHVEVALNPAAYHSPFFSAPAPSIEADHRAPLHGAFNIPYVMALAALGRRPGPGWFEPANLNDPQVWDLARRITTAPDPQLAEEWRGDVAGTRERRPRRTRGALTVRAGGREFRHETEFTRGDPWSPGTRAGWDDVTGKARDFCAGILTPSAIGELARRVRHLEDEPDLGALLAGLAEGLEP